MNNKLTSASPDSLIDLLEERYLGLHQEIKKQRKSYLTHEISNTELMMISKIAKVGPSSISELAKLTNQSRQAAHKSVHSLVEKQFVVVNDTAKNKRKKLVSLSQEGEAALTKESELKKKVEEEFCSLIGEEDFLTLFQLLQYKWPESHTMEMRP